MRLASLPWLLLLVGLAEPDAPLAEVGRLAHPAIRECSGIVASRRHPGVFWVHNDSGNPPRLFAVRADGTTLREFALDVPNVDWEDIAADDRGRLYVADIGNNDGRLPLRAVYQLDEPDPFGDPGGAPGPTPARVREAVYYRFGPGGRFDAEGLAVSGDGRTALIVAKTFDGRDAEVYELPLEPAAPLLRPATPRPLGTLPGFKAPATGADLDASGRLAVASPGEVGVYRRAEGGGWRRLGGTRFRGAGDVEAIAWDGTDLVLTNESGRLFRIEEARWRGPGGAVRDGR